MIKTTSQHKSFWRGRQIDWEKDYWSTWDHPHRQLMIDELKKIDWQSLYEIGCGGGANIERIIRDIGQRVFAGLDINDKAIEFMREKYPAGIWDVDTPEDIPFSDKSTDVLISDAVLIYYGPRKIKKVIKEIERVTRHAAIFFELHSESWLERESFRLFSGYNVYDYKKLLTKFGFYNIEIKKMPCESWPGAPWEIAGHIIIAKI